MYNLVVISNHFGLFVSIYKPEKFNVGSVNNYGDPNNVRNCYLVGLTDLYGGKEYVRNMVG